MITRRTFFKQSAAAGTLLLPVTGRGGTRRKLADREARYYRKLPDYQVQCELCPWQCIVGPGRRGRCEVRENRDGTYLSLVYGRISAHHNDPIEKKPFYHFLPGTAAFSLATAGCNVDCKFCQNWELARRKPEELQGVFFTPEEIVSYAKKYQSASIAFTYNEPTIYTEFIYDVASVAKEAGLSTVIISNGFISPKPLKDLCRVVDAYKVDLKSFSEDYYRNVVQGALSPVLDTLTTLRSLDVWTEIVYLTVPTLNDDQTEIRDMVKWIRNELGSDVPLHFSRFHPQYKLRNLPPTPVSTLETCARTALDGGIRYVYLGNIPGHSGENTYCPACKKLLIGRIGFTIFRNELDEGKCPFCGSSVAGVWKK